MALAQDFGLDDLNVVCEEHVISIMSPTNACTFLSAALDIEEKSASASPAATVKCVASLMDRCIVYIGENASECVKTNAFVNLSKNGLIKLISSDYVISDRQKRQL